MALFAVGPLLWSLFATLCMVSVWTPTAAAQAVTGVKTGINTQTGQRPARLNINDIYRETGPTWDLLVQALDLFQRDNMNNVLSYYQISGIHGLPYQAWNGVNQVRGGQTTGYCPHGQIIFPTWHRPYVALYEQTLVQHALAVANRYPASMVNTYIAAAQSLRAPFWDWATNPSLPDCVTLSNVMYNGPNGSASMRNPLYSYQFQRFPFPNSQFNGPLAQFSETKRCTRISNPGVGTSDFITADAVLVGDGTQLRDKVYAVFTQSSQFEEMASTANSGSSFEDPHNMVHNDIACYSRPSRDGHMGDLGWSAFDPLFMLHHANVDRLFAMWQAIYYHDPVFTTTQQGYALFASAPGPLTASSPLKPFTKTNNLSNPAWYTSQSVKSIRSFGYTYPEISDWNMSADSLAASVRTAVNNLYGPNAPGLSSAKRSQEASAAATNIAGVLASSDFSIEISVDRAKVPLPCRIDVYLAPPNSSRSAGSEPGTKIGSTSLLSMPQAGMSYSVLPLRRALLREVAYHPAAARRTADSDPILTALGSRIYVQVKVNTKATITDLESAVSFVVLERSFEDNHGSSDFPTLGPVSRKVPLAPVVESLGSFS